MHKDHAVDSEFGEEGLDCDQYLNVAYEVDINTLAVEDRRLS